MTRIRILIQVEPYEPLEVASTEVGEDEGPEAARNSVGQALRQVAKEVNERGLSPDLERPINGRGRKLS